MRGVVDFLRFNRRGMLGWFLDEVVEGDETKDVVEV